MQRAYFVRFFCFFLCLIASFLLAQSNPAVVVSRSANDAKSQAGILDQYGKLPLGFEANHGQTDSQVKFLSRTGGYSLFLTSDEAVMVLGGGAAKKTSPQRLKPASLAGSGGMAEAMSSPFLPSQKNIEGAKPDDDRSTVHVLRMKLRGANPAARISGVGELPGSSNYFVGNDSSKWRTNVPTYAKVKYEGIYPGIDLIYYGNQRQLEYDFIVAPGADPRRIGFDVRGARRIFRDAHGDLVFKMDAEDIRWHRPVVYQKKDGKRQLIAARYVVTDGNRVGFAVGKYDERRALYIDPLIYSMMLGASGGANGNGIAVDTAGSAYITGSAGPGFPVTSGAFQATGPGTFVSKLDPTGSTLVYSTYLGGAIGDGGSGIVVDASGYVYVTGQTTSNSFPITPHAFQAYCALNGNDDCDDAFVAKIDPTGSALVYSTYLGASAAGTGIAVGSAGDAYITGYTSSTDFPVTSGAFQTVCGGACNSNAFVTELNPRGSALVYSTFLGGDAFDAGYGIAVDSAGDAYVTGFTGSTNFPVTSGAFQTAYGGGIANAFVTEFNVLGSALVYSSYLGGTGGASGNSIALDGEGYAYVAGQAGANFPVAPRDVYHGNYDAFVTKFNPTGSALVYSAYLGGSKDDSAWGIAVDSSGNAYVTGFTGSVNFPLLNPLQRRDHSKVNAAFVSKFNPSGSALVYSTYLFGPDSGGSGRGIAVDGSGAAYIVGTGANDAFVAKLAIATKTITTLSSSPNPSGGGQTVTFTAAVSSTDDPPPDGESVSFVKGATVLGTGLLSGGSASFTISTLKVGTTSVKAVYGGDSNYAASTSTAVKQVVEK